MEVQTEFLWDEKNYTEQKMNCENKNEQETSDTMNDTKTSSTQIDWRDITDPKLRNKMRQKAYYEANKDKHKQLNKTYYEANKEKIKARQHANKERSKIIKKNYYELNKDKIRNRQKKYREANKENLRKYKKAWREANKEKVKEQQKTWREANGERRKTWRKLNKTKINKVRKNLRRINIQFKLSTNLRGRLNKAIKGNYKSGSAVKDLGCTIDELKLYLESKFQEDMSWDNWTKDGWHIDHIRPLSSFDLTNREEFLQACHYTNLQPLWAKDNFAKKDKII
jgi:hypothetical protein